MAIGRAIEEREAAAAKERQAAGRKRGAEAPAARVGKLPAREKGRASDKAAAASGVSRRTYEKARAVVEAGDAWRLARSSRLESTLLGTVVAPRRRPAAGLGSADAPMDSLLPDDATAPPRSRSPPDLEERRVG